MATLIDLLRRKVVKVKYLRKYNEKWSDEELLAQVFILNCPDSQLETLSELPNAIEIDCSHNKLTKIPNLLIINIL